MGNSPLTQEQFSKIAGLLEPAGHRCSLQDTWFEPAFPWEACLFKYFTGKQKVESGISLLPDSAVLLPAGATA